MGAAGLQINFSHNFHEVWDKRDTAVSTAGANIGYPKRGRTPVYMRPTMPMPWTYRHASKEWRAFLDDAKERMGLVSDNAAYTAVDGVFQTFRRRLTAQQGLDFASVLPSVLRAIFVQNWDVTGPPLCFGEREELIEEVKSLRRDHNQTPDNAIEATAWALWRATNHRDLRRILDQLPEPARAFWQVDVEDAAELQQRII